MKVYNKILIAVDGSRFSMNAAEKGLTLARRLRAKVALVFVIDDSKAIANPDSGTTSEQALILLKKEAQQTLDQLSKMYDENELIKFMPEGHPLYKEIIELAQTWEADLVIMGTHGRTGLEHLLMGSVAEHVTRHSDIPIMIVPTKSKE